MEEGTNASSTDTLASNMMSLAQGMQHMYETISNLQETFSQMTINNRIQHAEYAADPFRIHDLIKSLSAYTGNKNQLMNWLTTAEKRLKCFETQGVPADLMVMYTSAVIDKIQGKLRDLLCVSGSVENETVSCFDEVKKILLRDLTEKHDLTSCNIKIWNNKMNGNLEKYYHETKEMVNIIKNVSKQDSVYGRSWEAVEKFIDSYTLAAFLNGLDKEHLSSAQSLNAKSIDETYTMLVKCNPARKTFSQRTSSRTRGIGRNN